MTQVSVAAQAELMEKEKSVMEHQQRLESLRETVRSMANRQGVLTRSKRRAELTVRELVKLPSDHVTYRGIGRAFFRSPVNELIDQNNESIERSEAELRKLSNEKQRSAELVVREEGELRKALEDYQATLQVIQAAQNRSGPSGTKADSK